MQSPYGGASNFEELLKKNTAKKPSAIYNTNFKHNSTIQPQDVLDNVYSQIRTMQLADRGKVKQKEVNKSGYLMVNKLPVYIEVQKQNNFETQCFSNTQLINVIEVAEALNDGMTQEFESSFIHTIDDINKPVPLNVIDNTNNHDNVAPNIETHEFDTTFTQTNVDATISFLDDAIERDNHNKSNNSKFDDGDFKTNIQLLSKELYTESELKHVDTLKVMCNKAIEGKPVELSKKIESGPHIKCEKDRKLQINAKNSTTLIHKDSKYMDLNEDMKDNDHETTNEFIDLCKERSPSPVFEIKTKQAKTEPSNLVVSLQDFEEFEEIALPCIDINKDLDTCKHLINSLILERELCLNTDDDEMFFVNGQFSPILEKSIEITFDNAEEKGDKRKTIRLTKLDNIKESRDKRSDSLKDEILFSSDEESDFVYRDFQDIPLTAALENSSQDHSEVLDKTMFVGFQTASNKFIQICTDSFYKAQNLLDKDNNNTDFSMNELVENYDEKNYSKPNVLRNQKSYWIVKPKVIEHEVNEERHDKEKTQGNTEIEERIAGDYNDTVNKSLKEPNFNRFMTAGSKKTNIPDKSLELGRKIFMDINFSNNNDYLEQDNLVLVDNDSKLIADAKDSELAVRDKTDININDDLLIQEFENIEMSLEEIENKDNLSVYEDPIEFKTSFDKITCNEVKENFQDVDLNVFNEESEFDMNNHRTDLISDKNTNEERKTTKAKFVGFKTANDKNIKVSARAMSKTRAIFKDIDKNDEDINLSDEYHQIDYNLPSTSKTTCIRFKTANKRDINISDAALMKSSNIFKDIDSENADKFKKVVPLKHNMKVTAENIIAEVAEKHLPHGILFGDVKKITENYKENVNNNNLKSPDNRSMPLPKKCSARMKKLFQNLDVEHQQDHAPYNNEPKCQSPNFKGFQTASRKPVSISEQALKKSKNIFQEIDIYNKANPFKDSYDNKSSKSFGKQFIKETDEPDSVGPKTASIKNVNLTKEALVKSKRVLDFDNSFAINRFMSERAEQSLGFQTASTKNVKISKVPLEKTKSLINNVEIPETKNDTFNAYKDNGTKVEHPKEAIENTILLNSDIDKPKSNDGRTLVGVQTASNKGVKISEKALKQTKTLFNDIEILEIKKHHTFVGFHTASNKKVEISKEAMDRTKTLFNDIDLTVNENIGDLQGFQTANKKKVELSNEAIEKTKAFRDIAIHKLKVPAYSGFQTASNKKIKISKAAMIKTTTLFSDIDIPVNEDISEFQCFQTANNKKLAISKEAMEKTKTLVSDINLPEDICEFRGFQTANNNKVGISKPVIEEPKTLFNDIDLANEDIGGYKGFQKRKVSNEAIRTTETFFHDNEIPQLKVFSGFQTASKKKVVISKVALEKTKTLFSDIDLPVNKDIHEFQGFQTANNKNLELSKETTDYIFTDIDLPVNEDIGEFRGFQTANKVGLSKEAMERTNTLSDDLTVNEDIDGFKGFQTANRKKVEVSHKATEITKIVFHDIEIPKLKAPAFSGFQTASKKKVEISKEAIEKTKSLFSDIDVLENKDGSITGFQTANKNKVTVSEQALAKSKHFFQDKLYTDLTNEDDKIIISRKNTSVTEDTFKTPKKNLDTANNSKHGINVQAIKENIKLLDPKSDNLDNLVNTQVLDDFGKSLCTEDFQETPKHNKRSGSPILSCPKAKKRKKFEAPYKEGIHRKPVDIIKTMDKHNMLISKATFSKNYKKKKSFNIQDLSEITAVQKCIDPYILELNLENILNFVFAPERNDITGIKMNITELKEIFLSAVNKNLIPEGWLDNHIKLILWKLLSYELRFDFKCTLQKVIDQLKYRYDKELYDAERPALRKILERDDVSTKTMVLCVAGIYGNGVSVSSATNKDSTELLLTDGWYFIKATIDSMLQNLVAAGKIVVGSKIATCGAELVNCEQGISPWEDTSAVRLKLFGNSTRPARWHAKLGYTRAAILTQLSAVRVDGGKISKLRVFVTRVYPLLYVEKFEDGSTVTRSERLEHLHQMKYEAERELMMERIYEEVQREFDDQESQDSEVQGSGKRSCYDSGTQIAKMMKRSRDPMEFRAQLTSSQVQLLQDHTSRSRQKMLDAIQDRIQERAAGRNVVSLARGRVAAVEGGAVAKGMLSIWKPTEAVLDLFREGSSIEVMNAVPTAVRYSEMQITAGRQTLFRAMKNSETPPTLLPLIRKCYKISDVAENPSIATDYNEIDTVGIVFLIEPTQDEFKTSNNFQNVFLADVDKNIICINFWGGIKKFGFENILDTGQIVACANLQKRAGNTRKNIPQFRVTELTTFTKTPRNVQARELVDDLSKKMFGLDRRKLCDDCVAIKNNYTAIRCLNYHENESPYRFNNSDYSFTRNKMFIDTPLGVKVVRNEDVNLNLTGLDFESSFNKDTELSPNTLQKKKKVNEKIARLKMYGDPPPLSPINIINKSINAKNSYKSPLIPSNAATSSNLQNSVAIANNLPEESPKAIPRSPVLTIKRSYVQSVPVKLNFEEKSESVDHFAEDFDASPPLSLD